MCICLMFYNSKNYTNIQTIVKKVEQDNNNDKKNEVT